MFQRSYMAVSTSSRVRWENLHRLLVLGQHINVILSFVIVHLCTVCNPSVPNGILFSVSVPLSWIVVHGSWLLLGVKVFHNLESSFPVILLQTFLQFCALLFNSCRNILPSSCSSWFSWWFFHNRAVPLETAPVVFLFFLRSRIVSHISSTSLSPMHGHVVFFYPLSL